MQAIILAAGMGKRLKELTQSNTKCMVKVNGEALVDRMLSQLDQLSLNRIIIVVGYKGELLKDYISHLSIRTPIVYEENPIYDKTNNIYSLFLAREHLGRDDTILLESDLIFEDSVLEDLINDPRPSLALVDKYESWMDGTVVKLRDDNSISDFVPGRKIDFSDTKEYYKTVNIYKFSRDFSLHTYIPFLEAYCKALGMNEYYEQVLKIIVMLDDPEIRAKKLKPGTRWYEIDDVQDLDIAESIFASPDRSFAKISARYGGYWRYPKMLDFCYLVNPYYPPPKSLCAEIKANFDELLTQYPSSQRIDALLAAKYYGVDQKYVVVGNGAAELINCLISSLSGKLGVILPTFEEYRQRFSGEIVTFDTKEDTNFHYSAKDLVQYFDDKGITSLALINPDNPSGNFLDRQELKLLLEWSKRKGIALFVDESFVDFAEKPFTLLDNQLLSEFTNLAVIKSISKSHGVPGVRLGILATANEAILSKLRSDISIWNINSFAEYYLQIAEKYKKDFDGAMWEFRVERARFKNQLAGLPGVKVIDSEANFFIIKVTKDIASSEIAIQLLHDYKILVKDLSAKMGNRFLRVAIRNAADNDKLVSALKDILK